MLESSREVTTSGLPYLEALEMVVIMLKREVTMERMQNTAPEIAAPFAILRIKKTPLLIFITGSLYRRPGEKATGI